MGHPDGKSAPKSTWQPALPMLCRKVLPENCRKGPPGEPRVLPHQVWERGGGRAAVGLAGGPPEQAAPPAYRGPVRPDLPLAADLELAGAGGLGLLQVLAAVGLHRQAAVGVHLATQNLAVLHAQAAGLAALGPLPDVPASAGKREREGPSLQSTGREHLTRKLAKPMYTEASESLVTGDPQPKAVPGSLPPPTCLRKGWDSVPYPIHQ